MKPPKRLPILSLTTLLRSGSSPASQPIQRPARATWRRETPLRYWRMRRYLSPSRKGTLTLLTIRRSYRCCNGLKWEQRRTQSTARLASRMKLPCLIPRYLARNSLSSSTRRRRTSPAPFLLVVLAFTDQAERCILISARSLSLGTQEQSQAPPY